MLNFSRQIPKQQAGFIKGKRTRKKNLNLGQIMAKAREFYMYLYLYVINYLKVFDKVIWKHLRPVLEEMELPMIYLISKLNQQQYHKNW